MSFLEKSALWVLLAAAVIIVAYLLKMPRRRHLFSSILVFLGMERMARRERRKLRTLISFLVLLFSFLAIALDAARPYLSSSEATQRDHILLIDISASMKAVRSADAATGTAEAPAAESRFDRARGKALELVRALPVGDRMLVMTLGDFAQIARNFESDIKLLEESVNQLQPLDTSTRWDDAARLLGEVLPTCHAPVVHLVTDGSGFQEPPWAALSSDVEWRYHSLGDTPAGEPKPASPRNIAITNFRARTTFHSDRDFQVIIQLRNYSDKEEEVDIDLYVDDLAMDPRNHAIMDTRRVTLEPRQSSTEVFQQTLTVGGILSGHIAEPNREKAYQDALPIDNVAYDIIPSPTRPKVLIFAREQDKAGFLKDAFSANSNALAYWQSPERYSPSYGADIYVFYNADEIPPNLPSKDIIFVNTRGKAMPVPVQEEFKNPMMRTWNRHHPLMNYLTLSNLLLAKAQGFMVPGWAETLAETASGPLIVAAETPERQVVFIGLDPKDSDISFRGELPILLANAVLWMKERAPDPEPVRPGATYPIRVMDKNAKTFDLTRPGGTTSTFEIPPDRTVSLVDLRQTGVYRFRAGEDTGTFTVNLSDADESDLSCPDSLPIGGKAIARFEEEKAPWVWRLWPALAVLALGILIIENSLYHRRVLF